MVHKMFEHDYKKYPELTNTELEVLNFSSPHTQIEEDFLATVVKVHDGDTITLRTNFRDFDFPLRLLDIDAPELNEEGGEESKKWLEDQILDAQVEVLINKNNRVGKFGRLLGKIFYKGLILNDMSMMLGYSKPFASRDEGEIPTSSKYFLEGAI